MKKRILALVCLLAILVGVLSVGAAANTQQQDDCFEVGYAKKDVNPWVKSDYVSIGIENITYSDAATMIDNTTINNPSNINQEVQTPLVKVGLAGYGSISTRRAESVSDDNGDGYVLPGEDGLQVTVTSVTDNREKTVMFITIDSIGAYGIFTGAVRDAIVAALPAGAIDQKDIMVSGSHSHEAPDLGDCAEAAEGTAVRAYYDYYVARTVEAAVEAYEGRTEATTSKGSIEASKSMAAQGYGEIKMNFVRHYNVTETREMNFTSTTEVNKWVGGDSFGSVPKEGIDEGWFSRDTIEVEHVSEANETMNVLKFAPTDGGKPIVLIQWQAHPAILGNSSRTNISSDYVNALRYRLENSTKFGGDTDYCVGFWQGTGGNINNSSKIASEYSFNPANPTNGVGWTAIDPEGVGLGHLSTENTTAETTMNLTYQNALYGYLLGQIALDCLKNNMTECSGAGGIRTIQVKYRADRQKDDPGLVKAAEQWEKDSSVSYPYTEYTHSDGKVYALNSLYHAEKVLERARSTSTYTNLELNAILLGDEVALVTAPVELFDRYSDEGSFTDNDWDDLEKVLGYKPFILSKSNNRTGYLPNAMAYDYYTDNTGTVDEDTPMGSYEANTTVHAKGTGEKVVAKLAELLKLAQSGYVEKECPACEETVVWTPLTAESATVTEFGSGHYYLSANMPRVIGTATQKKVSADQTLCINLNGHEMEAEGRSFNVEGKVNLFNDKTFPFHGETGISRSYTGSNNASGGYATIAASGTFNLYGGTLEFKAEDTTTTKYNGTGRGGIFALSGELNMYGGTISGAGLVNSAGITTNNGCGAAIYMSGSSARLNVYGGEIISGTLPMDISGMGPCVFMSDNSGQIKLCNDAIVKDIFLRAVDSNNVIVSGTYTGTTNLSFHSDITLYQGRDIGDAVGSADISGATITFTDTTMLWEAVVSGTDLLLYSYDNNIVAAIDGTGYTSLQAAVDAYNGTTIKMIRNENGAVDVDEGKDIYLDLNGCTVESIAVNSGTLYCKDSKTDDYDVSDEVYGKIKAGSGDIQGISPEKTGEGYLRIEEEGALSFHKVRMILGEVVLRNEDVEGNEGAVSPAMYYKSDFKGDQKVQEKVVKFGVALSVVETPNATNLDRKCERSWFVDFEAGSAGNSGSSTLLKGIMKPGNTLLRNHNNMGIPIYGRTYLETEDGFIFGKPEQKTLKRQILDIDPMWDGLNDAQKGKLIKMYRTYADVFADMELPNMKAAADAQ